MNKIYKVVWNQAKNMYVVVSELAKNTTKGCSTKKLLTMLIATGVMSAGLLVGGMKAEAARVENGEAVQSVEIYNEAAAQAKAYGQGSIAIGMGATTGTQGVAGIADENSTQEVRDKSGYLATAIGSSATATGYVSTAIGNSAKALNEGAVAIGSASEASGGQGSLAIGQAAKATGAQSTVIGYLSNANSAYSTAIGAALNYNTTAGSYSTAIGTYGNAKGERSVSIGFSTSSDGWDSIAVGTRAHTDGGSGGTIAVGYQASSTANNAIAVGSDVKAYSEESIAIGKGSVSGKTSTSTTNGNYTVALGGSAQATELNATALGAGAKATGSNATAVGISAAASADSAIAAGNGAKAQDKAATAIGQSATATGESDIVIGTGASTAHSSDTYSYDTVGFNNAAIAIGANTKADGNRAVAIGGDANAKGQASVALGEDATATGGSTTAVGHNTQATGGGATAVGVGSKATAYHAAAFGHTSEANGQYSLALGEDAKANAVSSIAQGTGAQALKDGAVAIGAGATAGTNTTLTKLKQTIIASGGSDFTAADRKKINDAKDEAALIALGADYTGKESTRKAFELAISQYGYGALAIGNGAKSTGTSSAVFGNYAEATDYNGVAVGTEAKSLAQNTVAVGTRAIVNDLANSGIAIGTEAYVAEQAEAAITMGENSRAMSTAATTIGVQAVSSGLGSATVGYRSNAEGEGAAAFGKDASATGEAAIAVGNNSIAAGAGNAAYGNGATAGVYSFDSVPDANGYTGDSYENKTVYYQNVLNEDGTVTKKELTTENTGLTTEQIADLVKNSTVTGAIAQGTGAAALATNSVAIGTGSVVGEKGEGSVAIGTKNVVTADKTFVLGSNVKGDVANSVYLGDGSTVVKDAGNNLTTAGVAGSTTTAGANGEVKNVTINGKTYGDFAGATAKGAVSVGAAGAERRIMNVAAGEISATSTDAINGSQLYAVAEQIKEGAQDGNTITTVKSARNNTIVNESKDSDGNLEYSVSAAGVVEGTNTNVTTVVDANGNITDYKVNLNDNIKLTKDGGVTIEGGDVNSKTYGDIVINQGNVSYGGNQITNMGSGSDGTDADGKPTYNTDTNGANIGDVKNISKGLRTTVTSSDNSISVTNTNTDPNGAYTYDIKVDTSKIDVGMKTFNVTTNEGAAAADVAKAIADGNTVDFSADSNLTVTKTDSATGTSVVYGLANDITVGEKGDPGTPGKDGVDGKIGVNGKDGSAVVINGKDGSIGLNGKDGANGLTIKGDKGEDGTTRIVYETKDGETTVKHEVATMDDGLTFGANSGNDHLAKLGTKVTVKGTGEKEDTEYSGENIKTTIDSQGNITVMMDKNIKGESVTVDQVVLNGKDGKDGISIKGEDGKDGVTRIVYETKDGETTIKHEVATLDDGLKFVGNDGTATPIAKKLNETLQIIGDGKAETVDGVKKVTGGNIQTSVTEDGEIMVELNKNLDLGDTGSVKMGDTTINNGGLTIKGSKVGDTTYGDIIINQGNVSYGGNQITNMGSGSDGVDENNKPTYNTDINGANIGDVKNIANNAAAAAKTEVTVNGGTVAGADYNTTGNLQVKVSEGANGQSIYDVKMNKDITVDSVTAGNETKNTKMTDSGVTVKDGDKTTSVTAGGVNVSEGNKSTNVGAGTITVKGEGEGSSIITIDGNSGTIGGLTNKTWDPNNFTSGQAATEDQLSKLQEQVNNYVDQKAAAAKTEVVEGQNTHVNVVKPAAEDGHVTYQVHADKSTVSGDDNITITKTETTDATTGVVTTDYNVALSNDITIGGQGKDGAPGKDGSIGVAGKDGVDGVTIYATNGVDGKDGVDGTNGHIGLTGNQGVAGKDGKDGVDGKDVSADITVRNGHDGVDGKNGADGMTRIVYEDKGGEEHEVATLDDGMKYSGDSGDQLKMKLNENVNIKGGATGTLSEGNIGVVADGKDTLTVKLADDIKVNSVTANEFKTKNVTINNDGIDAGDTNITNVKSGIVNGDDSDNTNAANIGDVKQIANQAAGNIDNKINKLSNRVDKGLAGAAALAALHPLDFDPDDKLTFAAGIGNYRGENAGAIGMFYRPDEKVMFSLGATVGNDDNMVNAGVSFSLDRTARVTNSKTAMAREILDMRAEMAELKAMVNNMGAWMGVIDEYRNVLFPDVPENHWAYEYVEMLANRGIIEGYPNGRFDGDRSMTRYEFAALLARALQKGAVLSDAIEKEFGPELSRIRVDRIAGEDGDKRKIERIRVNGDKYDEAGNQIERRDHYGTMMPVQQTSAK